MKIKYRKNCGVYDDGDYTKTNKKLGVLNERDEYKKGLMEYEMRNSKVAN